MEYKRLLDNIDKFPQDAVQSWLRTQAIYIYPVIDKYNDNDKVTWQCEVFVPYLRNYRIGNGLSYEDAMKLGIKEGIKILEEK